MACCTVEATDEEREQAAIEASMSLFEVSGRLFSGLCTKTVRPCRQRCSCWGSSAAGAGSWSWGLGGFGFGVLPAALGGAWRNECGDTCGCGVLERIKLAGYPIREISEVKIGGDTVDPATYRLDAWRWLVRLDDPGPPVVRRRWPACQNLALDGDQPGTFEITYRHGISPPESGRRAAAALACQIIASCNSGGGGVCKLPAGATRVQREGITVERGLLANWMDPSKPTGIPAIDLFLAAYWMPGRAPRRSAVWSPDTQPFPRRVGV